MAISTPDIDSIVQGNANKIEGLVQEIGKIVVGQEDISRKLMIALISCGHVLLEGMPGLAKTTMIKTLASACSLAFKRIQFTPDLLPADLIGTQIYNPQTGDFKVKKGPIFSHLVLADEINRAPAKVQSALLEAMEEKQVTIGDDTWPLQAPFLVMATQNPVEHEGTYSLPEAQIDRFLFKLLVDYPRHADEIEIVRRANTKEQIQIDSLVTGDELMEMRATAHKIHVSDKIRQYIVDLVYVTRTPKALGFENLATLIEYGASPRASIAIDQAARSHALLEGRSFVTPQDVKDVAYDVLRHRIKTSYEAEAEQTTADHIIAQILERVDVP